MPVVVRPARRAGRVDRIGLPARAEEQDVLVQPGGSALAPGTRDGGQAASGLNVCSMAVISGRVFVFQRLSLLPAGAVIVIV